MILVRFVNGKRIEKSIDGSPLTFEKAKDYSQLIPVKKRIANGKEVTYWISPEDRNEGKAKGQQDLFSSSDSGKESESGNRGYFDKLDKDLEEYQVKPLVALFKDIDSKLATKLEKKYSNYQFDRDTKEMDLRLDYETARFMRLLKQDPENKADYQLEYNEKTDRMARVINSRKRKMLRLEEGKTVKIGGREGKIVGFTHRGYPKVQFGSEEKHLFFEELAA